MRGITMKEMATILDNRCETSIIRTNKLPQKLQDILSAISSCNIQEIGSLVNEINGLDWLLVKVDGLELKTKSVKLFDCKFTSPKPEEVNRAVKKDLKTLLHILRSFTLASQELEFNPWYCMDKEFDFSLIHFVPLEVTNGITNELLGLSNVGHYITSWVYYKEAPMDYTKFKIVHFVQSSGKLYCVPNDCSDSNLNLSVEEVPFFAKYGTNATLNHVAMYYAYTGNFVNFKIVDEDGKVEIAEMEEENMEDIKNGNEQINMELMYSTVYQQHENENPYAEFVRLKRLFKSLKDELERNDIYIVLEFNSGNPLYNKRVLQLLEVKLNSILVMFGRNTTTSLSYTLGLEALMNKQIVSIQLFKQLK